MTVQVRILPIADAHAEAAGGIRDRLAEEGLRVELDDRSDTLGYRIRDGELQKIPYLLVVGDREIEAGTVAVRARGAKRKQEIVRLDDFVSRARARVEEKALSA